ncbi:hypothetical protein G6F66_012185 [Rhizopus arrhizus]|nr:hypothetical protein G6F66_012185 [Rhizopus arrhizus]
MEYNDNNINLSEETMELLYRAFVKRFNKEQEEKQDGNPLPVEITTELDGTSDQQQEENFKRFRKNRKKYEQGKWTTPERINPELYKEISRHKIDTTEAVAKIYEISETTRFQAKAITEIYEELQYVLQHTTNWEEARDIIQKSAEQSKRLAIFGFTQTKHQERIAKNYAIDALNLPPSIRHHMPKKENHKTTNAFSDEFLDELYQARWERDIITKQSNGHFQHSNRGRGNGYSRGNRGNSRSSRGGFRGGRSSFFGQHPGGNSTHSTSSNQHNNYHNNHNQNNTPSQQ